jgi:hypothetical protein
MATDANTAAWVFGGLADLDELASSSSSRRPARRTFHQALRSALSPCGATLISAELGRLRGLPIWVVTYELQDGVIHREQIAVANPPYEQVQFVARHITSLLGQS